LFAAFDAHAGNPYVRLSRDFEPCPEWIEAMGGHLAGCGILANMQGGSRYGDFFTRPGGVIIPAKSQIDKQNIEAEKSEDGPSPDGPEKNAHEQPATDQSSHQHGKARPPQRTIGREQGLENGFVETVGFRAVWVVHRFRSFCRAVMGLRQA